MELVTGRIVVEGSPESDRDVTRPADEVLWYAGDGTPIFEVWQYSHRWGRWFILGRKPDPETQKLGAVYWTTLEQLNQILADLPPAS
jgi:hypothetical protein